MSANLAERWADLPELLGGHLLLSLSALLVGVALSLPLGILAARSPRVGGSLLGAASVVQTIPSIALLALMVPILGGRIGFMPAFIALTLYSVLPVLRNTVAGINGVDPALTEAARGAGMTERQMLVLVQLPLAAPVIIAGIRTATVWVVGIATLATPVGAPSLGNYIFGGLQTRNWVSVMFGCVAAAVLAIVLDQLVRLAELGASRRRPMLTYLALAGLSVVFVGGLVPLASEAPRATALAPIAAEESQTQETPRLLLAGREITVGAKTFTEQYILLDVITRQLERHGARVKELPNLGSTILFDALRNDTIDLYVDYTGTIWELVMGRSGAIERTAMFIEVARYLRERHGILTVGRLGFENAYSFAMRSDRARELGIRSIADLAPFGERIILASDEEFYSRSEWVSLSQTYALQDIGKRSMDATFMYGAVRDGEVDVITAYTTDGRIAAFDLLILEDPESVFPPYDAIVLLAPGMADDKGLIEALSPLLNRIGNQAMREANRRVDLDRQIPKQAGEYLYRLIGE